ncbi:zinc finger protein 792 [Anabrus simplex]|uniref:zinc finger protein 792 n=1 Tax=Anabrus simplex TaxID=316456 RepID=UPI0035A2EE05
MDLEVKIKEEPIFFQETSNTSCCEMDQKIGIKEEPVWFEGTASASFDNYKITSDGMDFKGEPKSELAEPRETQPSTDIKDEISVDEHTIGQSVECFKEEDNLENHGLLTKANSGEMSIHASGQWAPCYDESTFRKHLHAHTKDRLGSSNEFSHISSKYLPEYMFKNNNVRPHSCGQCGYRFCTQSDLQSHLHTEKHPYYCDQCGKKFSERANLRQHMQIHRGERKHCCGIHNLKKDFTERRHPYIQCVGMFMSEDSSGFMTINYKMVGLGV